jgi:hypothetical protein
MFTGLSIRETVLFPFVKPDVPGAGQAGTSAPDPEAQAEPGP